MLQASIRLTRFISSAPTNSEGLLATRLILEAAGHNMPSEIFVMHRRMAGIDSVEALFEAVATPVTLESYPTSPDVTDDPDGMTQPYYRVSRVELLFDHPSDLEMIYWDIVTDVNYLVESMNALSRVKLSGSDILDGNTVTSTDHVTHNVTVLPLDWRPAGTPALSGADQVIINPDTTQKGWLPVSEYAGIAPDNAVFFYNLSADTVIAWAVALEVDAPFPVFSLNGYALDSSILRYENGQLWWFYFEAGTIYYPQDGNAPWPLDYAGDLYYGYPPKFTLTNPS